jgi:hypothetical protein
MMAQHFRVDLDGRVFAACAPYLTVERHRGLRLAVHAVLISCPRSWSRPPAH